MLVYIGGNTTCTLCHKPIAKGEKAERTQRRAETYRERCHADKRGNVSWYTHPECAPNRKGAPTQTETPAAESTDAR